MVENFTRNKDVIFKNLLSIIILFAIFFIEGCFNFLEFKFDFSSIGTPNFWISIGTRCLLMTLVKSLAMTIFLDKARFKNKDLNFQKSKNARLMKLKDPEFPTWVEDIKNPNIKKEAWIIKINKKLSRLEKYSSRKSKSIYYSKKESFPTTRYAIKRKFYESQISEDYLNKNAKCLNVKCQLIDSAGFNVPVNIRSDSSKYQIHAKTKTAIASSLFIASSWIFIMQIIREASNFQQSSSDFLIVIVGLLLDLVFLSWQFFTGILDAFKIIDQQEVLPYVNRNRILEEYFYYKNPNKKDVLKKLLEQLEESDENKDSPPTKNM